MRERDLGVFDGLTGAGIRSHYPEESQRRQRQGKFYYRPPGGESWTDVVQRVRQVLFEQATGAAERRLWIVTHQAVIMAFRLAIEGLNERQLMTIDRDEALPNCSLTRYRKDDNGRLELIAFAESTAVDESRAATTAEPSRSEPATREADEAGHA